MMMSTWKKHLCSFMISSNQLHQHKTKKTKTKSKASNSKQSQLLLVKQTLNKLLMS
jgi:hypothetical protein